MGKGLSYFLIGLFVLGLLPSPTHGSDSIQDLFSAIKKGDVVAAKQALDKGASASFLDRKGRRPLHAAAKAGSLDVVQLLLDNGANVAYKDSKGMLPLDYALKEGHQDIVNVLREFQEWTEAVSAGTPDAIKQFLANNPHSKFIDEARNRIDDLAWTEVVRSRKATSYQDYLTAHPDGLHAAEARSELLWGEAKVTNTCQAYQKYIDQCPEGAYVKEAEKAMPDLLWGQTQKDGSLESYQAFVAQYPAHRASVEASAIIRARTALRDCDLFQGLTSDEMKQELLRFVGVDGGTSKIIEATYVHFSLCRRSRGATHQVTFTGPGDRIQQFEFFVAPTADEKDEGTSSSVTVYEGTTVSIQTGRMVIYGGDKWYECPQKNN